MRTLGASVAVLASVWLAEAATISLTASINVNKAANFTPGRDTLKLLVENATREGLDKDAIRFVQSPAWLLSLCGRTESEGIQPEIRPKFFCRPFLPRRRGGA